MKGRHFDTRRPSSAMPQLVRPTPASGLDIYGGHMPKPMASASPVSSHTTRSTSASVYSAIAASKRPDWKAAIDAAGS